MLKDDEIKEIIKKNNLSDVEQLEVIRRYIFDVKGKDVGKIQRIKGELCLSIFPPQPDFQLLETAYNSALGYYLNKFNKN